MKNAIVNVRYLVSGVFLMVSIFLLEIYTGVLAGTVSYVLIALYVLWFSKDIKYLVWFGFLSSVLIVAGYFFTAEHVMSGQSLLLNRSLTFIGIWLALYVAFRYKKVSGKEMKLQGQLKALFDNVSEGIVCMDVTGRITITNPKAADMLEYSPGELTGMNIRTCIIAKSGAENADLLNWRQQMDDVDWWALTKQGKSYPVEVTLTRIDDEDGTVIAFFQDVSSKRERASVIRERLHAVSEYNNELELQVSYRVQELEQANTRLLREIEERTRVEQKLRQSEQLYSVMAHNFPDGIIGVLDKNLRYLFADGEELNQLRLSRENMRDRFVYDTLEGPESGELITGLAGVYEGKKMKREFELNDHIYSLTAVPLHGDSEEITEALIVIRNITQRKNVEKELRLMLERERDLNMLKSRFITSASHEFRTPLTTILSSVFLLQKYNGEEHAVKRRDLLDRIARAVHGLTELLNEFLSLGRLEEGKIEVCCFETDIEHFLRQLVEEMEFLKKEGQNIILRIGGRDKIVNTDPKILNVILCNLLSNAIKYSPAAADIHLTAEISSRILKLQVTDQGIGIPFGEQQHIFERFFRASNSSDIEGTGLGLNIARKYTDLLEGDISFESQQDKGTVFTICIPEA